MDYGFVPVTDQVTGWLNEMVTRRVPKTTMRTATDVHDFVKKLNDALALHPAGDLVIGAHANSEGQWFISLFPGMLNAAGLPTGTTEFEHIEQTMETSAAGLARRIRLDDDLIGFTTPPPTHFVHLKGCNLGKALPFLTKMKQALGDHVQVTAPKHFQAVVSLTKKNNSGSFEYMCYEFQVRTAAVEDPPGSGKFRGFANRADLLQAFHDGAFDYLGGFSVPDADWKKWVPNDITKPWSFFMALPLGATVAGLKAITLRPDKKTGKGGARQFRVKELPVKWQFAPPTSASTQADKIAALKTAMLLDNRFKPAHPWPLFVRAGYASMDDFMAGHHWTFPKSGTAAPMTIGRRIEYTVLLPITDNSGAKPVLIYNFFPAPGATQAAITTGISTVDLSFFAKV